MSVISIGFALLATLLSIMPSWAGDAPGAGSPTGPAAVRVADEGSGYRVTVEVAVPVEPSIAWSVLTDYNRFHEFLPGVRSSRVVRSAGSTRWVSQQGETRVVLFDLPVDVLMKVDEISGAQLRIELVSGNIAAMRGEWRLGPGAVAAATGAVGIRPQVLLSHSGFYAPHAGLVPRVIVRMALARQVQTVLDGYVTEMVRRSDALARLRLPLPVAVIE